MTNMDFLPDGYSIPEAGNKYYKFQKGENRFRILTSPIVGMEHWNFDNKPVRTKMGVGVDISQVRPDKDGTPGKVKHFWAMPVWDYEDGSLKVLEITQKGIMKAIKELASDKDWGSPVSYDLVVTRDGDGMETDYGVIPKPAKPVAKEASDALQAACEAGFDLEALYVGGDPFTGTGKAPAQPGEIDIDDIPFE